MQRYEQKIVNANKFMQTDKIVIISNSKELQIEVANYLKVSYLRVRSWAAKNRQSKFADPQIDQIINQYINQKENGKLQA